MESWEELKDLRAAKTASGPEPEPGLFSGPWSMKKARADGDRVFGKSPFFSAIWPQILVTLSNCMPISSEVQ